MTDDISTDGPYRPKNKDCAGCGLYLPCLRWCPKSSFLCQGCATDPRNQQARIDCGEEQIECARTAEAWAQWSEKNQG